MLYQYRFYKLIEPRNDTIRYIGITTRSLNQRLKDHMNAARKRAKSYICTDNLECTGNREKIRWLNDLRTNGLRPIIEEIEYIKIAIDKMLFKIAPIPHSIQRREFQFICSYMQQNNPLTNFEAQGKQLSTYIKSCTLDLSDTNEFTNLYPLLLALKYYDYVTYEIQFETNRNFWKTNLEQTKERIEQYGYSLM